MNRRTPDGHRRSYTVVHYIQASLRRLNKKITDTPQSPSVLKPTAGVSAISAIIMGTKSEVDNYRVRLALSEVWI